MALAPPKYINKYKFNKCCYNLAIPQLLLSLMLRVPKRIRLKCNYCVQTQRMLTRPRARCITKRLVFLYLSCNNVSLSLCDIIQHFYFIFVNTEIGKRETIRIRLYHYTTLFKTNRFNLTKLIKIPR